jgi:hypothetical protein
MVHTCLADFYLSFVCLFLFLFFFITLSERCIAKRFNGGYELLEMDEEPNQKKKNTQGLPCFSSVIKFT